MKKRIGVGILILLILAMISRRAPCMENGIKILVIGTPEIDIKSEEYEVIRKLLTSYTGLKSPFDTLFDWRLEHVMKAVGFKEFLNKNKYNLLLVIGCREEYSNLLEELMREYLKLNGSVLILPVNEDINYAISKIGIIIRSMTPVINVSTSTIAEHEVSRGVWMIGTRSHINHSIAITSDDFKAIVYSNKSWWKKEYPIVAIGEIDGGKVAVIVPPLYSEQYMDNFILLDNIVRWLLGLKIEREEGVPLPLKELDEVRRSLLQEIEDIKRRRREVIESLPEFDQLRREVLNAYRYLGIVCAIGFIFGYITSTIVTLLWRRKHERKSS